MVEVRSFNYYNVAINVLSPELFVQSRTIRRCLRLIEGGTVVDPPSKQALKTSDEWAWPAVQETHQPSSGPSAVMTKPCLSATPKAAVVNETQQPRTKLTYAAVARPGKVSSRTEKTVQKQSVADQIPNAWKTNPSTDIKKFVKNSESTTFELRTQRSATASLSAVSLHEFFNESSDTSCPTSKSQPTSPCLKALDFPLLREGLRDDDKLISTNSDITPRFDADNFEFSEHSLMHEKDASSCTTAESGADKVNSCCLSKAKTSEAKSASSVDIILPVFATASQSTSLFAADKWVPHPSSVSNPSLTTSSTEACSGDDGCCQIADNPPSSNSNPQLSTSSSPMIDIHPEDPPSPLSPSEPYHSISDESFSNEMFELLIAFPKPDTFMGSRLEIRDPIDPTNNVGRPSFNVTGIRV